MIIKAQTMIIKECSVKGRRVFHKKTGPWWRVWMLATLTLQSIALTLFNPASAQEPAPSASSLHTAILQTSLVQSDPFAALLTRRGPSAVRLSSREPQLYETTERDERFVFQASGRAARLRMVCSDGDASLECSLLQGQRAEEIILLTPTRSPRGDVIYKDDDGKAVLRVTANGGATLFSLKQRDPLVETGLVPLGGKAVLPVIGEADPLRAPPTNYFVVEERMRQATDLINRRFGSLVTFVAPIQAAGDHSVLADAVLTTAKGIDLVASDELGASIIKERLEMAQFVAGDRKSLNYQDGILTVIYNRNQDVAGRPSSAMIASFLESEL